MGLRERTRQERRKAEIEEEDKAGDFATRQSMKLSVDLIKVVTDNRATRSRFVNKAAEDVIVAAKSYFAKGITLEAMARHPGRYPGYFAARRRLDEEIQQMRSKRK